MPEITLPQDKRKGEAILGDEQSFGTKMAYKRKHVGQRSSKGWLSRMMERDEGDPTG